jgi:hypothetical protein
MSLREMLENLLTQQAEALKHLREIAKLPAEKKKNWADSVALWVAILAAVFTGWQAWEAHETRLAADDQFATAQKNARDDAEQARKDSESALRAQADIANEASQQAKRSANAAEQSNKLASDALRLSSRAYIGILDIRFGTPMFASNAKGPSPNIVSIRFDLKNYGGAPAQNVQVTAHCQVFDHYGKEKVFPNPIQPVGFNTGLFPEVSVIMPGSAEHGTCQTINLDIEKFEELKIVGQISYFDIFHTKHQTRFCYTNAIQNERGERSLSATELVSCPRGNQVD